MKSLVFALFMSACFICSAKAQLSSSPDTISAGSSELMIHPILHGSVVFTYDGKTVFADPYGGAELY